MLGPIDHVGIAVADLDEAIGVYAGAVGLPVSHRETLPDQGVEAALLDLGTSHVELLAPLGPDTTVGRFLASRGPGLHHVAYATTDIERALHGLEAAGLRLIDATPRVGLGGAQVAFLHPAALDGVLTELVQRNPRTPNQGGPNA